MRGWHDVCRIGSRPGLLYVFFFPFFFAGFARLDIAAAGAPAWRNIHYPHCLLRDEFDERSTTYVSAPDI